MIEEFSVTNFKAFKEKQTIPVKPITLVFGANSAGKSSLLQSLLWTKGAFHSGSLEYGCRNENDLIDLDSLRSVVSSGERLCISVALPASEKDPGPGVGQDILQEPLQVNYEVGWATSDWWKSLAPELPEELNLNRDKRDALNDAVRDYISALNETEGRYLIGEDGEQVTSHDESKPGLWVLNPDWNPEEINREWKPRLQELWDKVREEEQNGIKELWDRYEADLWKPHWDLFKSDEETAKPLLFGFELIVGGELLFRCERRDLGDSLVVSKINQDNPYLGTPAAALVLEKILLKEQIEEEPFSVEFNGLRPLAISSGSTQYREETWKLEKWLNNTILSGLASGLEKALDNFVYLGPLRSVPPRHMIGYDGGSDVRKGDDVWLRLREDTSLTSFVNEWLEKLDIPTLNRENFYPFGLWFPNVMQDGSLFGVSPHSWLPSGTGFEYDLSKEDVLKGVREENWRDFHDKVDKQSSNSIEELYLEDEDKAAEEAQKILNKEGHSHFTDLTMGSRSFRDVGTGVSQLMPVVVHALEGGNKTVMVEQPELHLHPAMQAKIGDLFIESAMKENGNRFLLETHSEHLILRILRRIRETSLGELPEGVTGITPDDVCVLFVEMTEEGSTVKEIPVTADGDFAGEWPGGFFEERLGELGI